MIFRPSLVAICAVEGKLSGQDEIFWPGKKAGWPPGTAPALSGHLACPSEAALASQAKVVTWPGGAGAWPGLGLTLP